MTYRLDYINDDGSVREPVMNTALRGDYTTSTFMTAVAVAVTRSELRPVAISRVSGGTQRRTAIVRDGKMVRAAREKVTATATAVMKVCPGCGNGEFHQRRVEETEHLVTVEDWGLDTISSETVTGGHEDGFLICTGCGTEYSPSGVLLISPEDYAARAEYDAQALEYERRDLDAELSA